MKVLFASDIHGSAYYCRKLVNSFIEENADYLVLLGDILYHGPRNDFPRDYNPKKVIEMLNRISDKILCVKGNCDAEVDQMVLNFTLHEDYKKISLEDKTFFITHGHRFNTDNPPTMKKGDILIHGHTHITALEYFGDDNLYLNPGSVSIPKENTQNGYMIFEDNIFKWKNLEGEILFSKEI